MHILVSLSCKFFKDEDFVSLVLVNPVACAHETLSKCLLHLE